MRPGIERLLLLKSLHETILCCSGRDTDLTADEIIARLKGFVDRHGKSVFLQLFLSLYFFNDLLLDARQSSTTLSLEEFERSIADVERMCRRAVNAAYADVTDRSTAETLINNIEAELRGNIRLAG